MGTNEGNRTLNNGKNFVIKIAIPWKRTPPKNDLAQSDTPIDTTMSLRLWRWQRNRSNSIHHHARVRLFIKYKQTPSKQAIAKDPNKNQDDEHICNQQHSPCCPRVYHSSLRGHKRNGNQDGGQKGCSGDTTTSPPQECSVAPNLHQRDHRALGNQVSTSHSARSGRRDWNAPSSLWKRRLLVRVNRDHTHHFATTLVEKQPRQRK